MKIEIEENILTEFEYMLELFKKYGSAHDPHGDLTTEELISYILSSIAAGSRRPGSWERGMLDAMGLVADCEEHYVYRSQYGVGNEG